MKHIYVLHIVYYNVIFLEFDNLLKLSKGGILSLQCFHQNPPNFSVTNSS